MDTVFRQVVFESKHDGFEDRYLIEHPRSRPTGPMVVYLHAGLSRAEQAFCIDHSWCVRSLRDEAIRRGGVYLSPDYRGDSWMNAAAEADLADLVAGQMRSFGLTRLVVTGASMGGTAALIFASHHADIVDGVVALCPATDMRDLYEDLSTREELYFRHVAKSIPAAYGGKPARIPDEYVSRSSIAQAANLTMPIVIRHGIADNTIRIEHPRKLAEVLRAQGTPVRLDEVDGGHDAPTIDTPWRDYLDFVLRDQQETDKVQD